MRGWGTKFSGTALALVLAGASAWAQQSDGPPSPLQGQPATPYERFGFETLQGDAPPDSAVAPVPETPQDTTYVPPKPAVMGTGGQAAVEVSNLDAPEGPVAGLLDDSSGGLGYDLWAGSNRATLESLLAGAPTRTASPSARSLLNKVLLTKAPSPEGAGQRSFVALRIAKLMDGGFTNNAADIASQADGRKDPDIARAQADALLYAGRDDAACGDITGFRLTSAEPFWVELRAYCYAVAGDADALALTRAVIDAKGIADPAFMTLLSGISGAKIKTPPASIPDPTALHVRMLDRLGLPMTIEIVEKLGMPGALAAARSAKTPKDLRFQAARLALRAGALSSGVLRQVLDSASFKPEELQGASALSRSEDIVSGLARLRAALKTETAPDKRAELIYAAFQIADRDGLLPQVANTFADEAVALVPAQDWNNWSALMVRGLLLAGKGDAAQAWADILDAKKFPEGANRLQLAMALAAPNEPRTAQSQTALAWLSGQAAKGQPAMQERAAIYLGLFDALGRPMPENARAQISALMGLTLPGRRLSPAQLTRIDDAVLAGRRGEAVLAIAAGIGPGAGDLAPDVTVRLVRALKGLGLHDAAQALAAETVLTRR